VQALGRYAHDLGLAFQIVDDVLDLIGNPELMGKPAHEDAGQHKLGVMTVAAGALPGQLVRDTDVMTLPVVTEDVAAEALAKARELAGRANAALAVLPPSPARDALAGLAHGVVERDR
jgi:geranylgeranyl pyrophosphate synthase